MKLILKTGLMAALLAGVALVVVPMDAEAKRLGGARSSGTQRQAPDKPVQKAPPEATPNAAPGSPAAAPAAAGAAAKAAPAAAAQSARSRWMGPLMGLAAGLGLAALFSHLGMGETFSSIMMILLLSMVAFGLFRWFMSRRAKANGSSTSASASPFAMAGAGAGAGSTPNLADAPVMAKTSPDLANVKIGSALIPPLAVPGVTPAADASQRYLPADFDSAAFERIAKTVFVRMQTANDDRNLDDIRSFTTPEMFAELRTDLLERGDAAQRTEVISVNPTVIDFAEEGNNQIVSVRYVGVIRETADGGAESFDEVWHLVKARDGGNAWRIAGIQQAG